MILVTGPDGFVGVDVCGALSSRGHSVRGAQRKTRTVPPGCEAIVVGDINGQTIWSAALNDVDAIVHLAARVHVMNDTSEDPMSAYREVNVEGTRRLAESAVARGVRHFIFISSIKVNGEETTKQPFSEEDIPKPEGAYSESKWEAEQVLRDIEAESDLKVTILRLPLLYGPSVKANFLKLIRLVDRGIPIPFGSVTNKRSLLGLGNLSDLICHCIDHPESQGETFVVSDGQDLSTAELVDKIGLAINKKPRLVPIPIVFLHGLSRMIGRRGVARRLTSSLVIDSTKVRTRLNWHPPYSVEHELKRTGAWYAEHMAGSIKL